MSEPLLTARQAAAYVNVSYAAFDQMVRRVGIPHERWGRVRRFRKDVLDRALRTMTQRYDRTRRTA
jgi:excisionase family DNA binding protein